MLIGRHSSLSGASASRGDCAAARGWRRSVMDFRVQDGSGMAVSAVNGAIEVWLP
jgi:hypothetical protein